MVNLIWDDPFVKKIKKISKKKPELLNLFKNRIKILSQGPFQASLRTHKLTGNLKNYYACSLDYQYRLLFRIVDQENILLIDIGTHDEVY